MRTKNLLQTARLFLLAFLALAAGLLRAEDAPAENLALHKPAAMSSAAYHTHPEGGNDGIINGRYGFHTQKQKHAWWQVDLGQVSLLKEVVVYNRQDCGSDRANSIGLLLSNDGEHWVRIYQHTHGVFGGLAHHDPLRVNLEGRRKRARFVRLQLEQCSYLHLDEIEVYGYPAPPEERPVHDPALNVALNRPASMSSRHNGTTAEGGNDGVLNGRYGFHTKVEKHPWWQVDLGQVFALQALVAFNREDCCADRARSLEVLLSLDGQVWESAYRHPGWIFGGRALNDPLEVNLEGKRARYVRLQLRKRNYLHLDEVQVFRQQP